MGFADQLRWQVPSGSITYEAWRKFVEFVDAASEWVKFGAAFVAGLVHGALESVWDAVVGLANLVGIVWDLLEAIFKGEIVSSARALWNVLSSKESFNAVMEAVGESLKNFESNWNAKSSLKRGRFRGWGIGYIFAEVLMAIFTAGIITAVKWSGRLGNFFELVKFLKPIRKIIDKTDDMVTKGGEAIQRPKKH